MSRRRSIALALAAFALVAVTTACFPAPQTNKVVAVGDSLMVGAEWGGLSDGLRRGGFAPTVNAKEGRRADQAVATVSSLTTGRTGTLLIGLGTNDGPDRASFRRDIDAIMAAAHGWPVVWLLVESGPAVPVNQEIVAASKRYDNLRIADFSPTVRANPGYRTPDGIHLTYAGYQARARYLVAQCAQPA